MITVRLQGGLGNQLFQWAFGLAAAKATGQTLRFDSARLYRKSDRLTPRELKLPIMDPQAEVVRLGRLTPKMARKGWQWLPAVPRWVEEEQLSPLHIERLAGGDTLVSGFFQSETWFEPAVGLVRQKLRSARQQWLSETGQPALAQLLSGAIGLHVRRGDYLKLSHIHPPVDETYIESALRYYPAELPVFVCSDDLPWAQHAVEAAGRAVISEPGEDVDDFFRLSLCSGKIISNSTFSWWAAWIDDEADGRQAPVIVRPDPWFGGAMADSVAEAQICPQRWHRAARN